MQRYRPIKFFFYLRAKAPCRRPPISSYLFTALGSVAWAPGSVAWAPESMALASQIHGLGSQIRGLGSQIRGLGSRITYMRYMRHTMHMLGGSKVDGTTPRGW